MTEPEATDEAAPARPVTEIAPPIALVDDIEPIYRTVPVTLQTAKGPISIALEVERAPKTSANFLRYVREGRFQGTDFYRAVEVAPGMGLIQGGTRGDPKLVLPAIAHEPTSETGIAHEDGTISMAMGAPGTADGDFFIIVGNLTGLDAENGAPGFAAFGKVTDGMNVVRQILTAATDPNEGEGVMKGQFLADPVAILTAKRTD
ncbi:MAG: peptidylprolyl isomerase [Pseudomonadota bacterium]